MSKVLVSVALLVLATVSVRATILPGRCPVVSVKDGFDVKQYVGKWYEIRSYFAFYQIGVNCSRANYTLLDNGKVRVNNTATARNKNGTQIAINVTGVAYAPNPAIPSKLVVQFDNRPPNKTADYWVVETDYTNFGIVWSCQNIAGGLFHEALAWVLGRSPTGFNGDIEAVIDKSLATHNIDATLFNPTVQENCVN